MPTLSVCMSALNEERYVGDQLHAVTCQTRSADELVLIDDGSKDDTWRIISVVRHPSLKLCRHFRPSGICAAYNKAVSLAVGEWLYLASANDQVDNRAFERWEKTLSEFPECRIMAGNLVGLGLNLPRPFIGPDALVAHWQGSTILQGAGVFIRRDVWCEFGGYHPKLEWMADWWLYHAAAFRYGIAYIPHNIALSRQLPNGYSQGYKDQGRLDAVVAEIARLLNLPENADVRGAILRSKVMDVREAGYGAPGKLVIA